MLDPTITRDVLNLVDFQNLERFRAQTLKASDLSSYDGLLSSSERLNIGASAWVIPSADADDQSIALVSVGKEGQLLQLSADSSSWGLYSGSRPAAFVPFRHVFGAGGLCKRCGRPNYTSMRACYGRPPEFTPKWCDKEDRITETIAETLAVDVTGYSLGSTSRSPYEGNPSLDDVLACTPHDVFCVDQETDCYLFEDGSIIVAYESGHWEASRKDDWHQNGWEILRVEAFGTKFLIPSETT